MNPDQVAARLTDLDAEPYPLYRQLRAEDPVHWNEPLQCWLVTRYADVAAGFKDPRLTPQPWAQIFTRLEQAGVRARGLQALMETTLRFSEPSKHARMRALAIRAFAPELLASSGARTEATVEALLADLPDDGRIDLARDVAAPLTLALSAQMFAVLGEELARVLHWFEDLREAVTGDGASPTQWERADGSVVRLMEHFRTVVAERQAQPGDDLLSAMITVEVGGERFTTDELVALCVQLLDGHQPTVFPLISNGMLALLRNPDQLQRLRDEPALLQQMVEELLRYAGAQQSVARVATEDVEIGGRLIRQDEKVALMVVAANRDPAQFLDADRLDVGRQPNRHLAFGLGSHFCLGAPLLRVEAPIIFRGLLEHLPGLRLDESRPIRWAGNFSARRVVELPVLVDSTASL